MTKAPFSLRLEPDLFTRIKDQAKREHRPVNNLIELALIRYLEENEPKKETPTE